MIRLQKQHLLGVFQGFFGMDFRVINFGLGLCVFLATVVLGGFLAFSDIVPGLLGGNRVFLIAVLFFYGLFRLYRAIKAYKHEKE